MFFCGSSSSPHVGSNFVTFGQVEKLQTRSSIEFIRLHKDNTAQNLDHCGHITDSDLCGISSASKR